MKSHDVAIETLKPNTRNARRHSKNQISQIAESIRQFGFVVPIVADENGVILAGHGRYEAAKLLELPFVPVVQVHGLSTTKKRALGLADNKIAQNAGWDREQLAVELSELSELLIKEDLDISVTGFDTFEIDQITAAFEADTPDPADAIDSQWVSNGPVTQRGELWRLGDHRVLCGDAHDPDALARLMGRDCAAMAFLDPLYNVRVCDIVGRPKHQRLVARSECVDFSTSMSAAASMSRDGAVHFVCSDWRHFGGLLEASRGVYGEMLDLAVWIKTSADQSAFYRNGHELIAVFRVGNTQNLNTVELARRREKRSNVWRYQDVKITARMDKPKSCLIVKPVRLVADAMEDCTRRGDIVFDPFSGLGTAILAAERTDRHARAIENDPRFVDAAIRRWQASTHKHAVHMPSGRRFDELAECRAAAPLVADVSGRGR